MDLIKTPFSFDGGLDQEDFMEMDFLEGYSDALCERKSLLKTYLIELACLAGVSVLLLCLPGVILESQYFVLIGLAVFTANFVYNYWWGYKSDFQNQLRLFTAANAAGNRFFAPEDVHYTFEPGQVEYASNEQHRFFSYDKILYLDETRHLYVMGIRRTKEPQLKNFPYMLIAKRYLDRETTQQLQALFEAVKKEYGVGALCEKHPFR